MDEVPEILNDIRTMSEGEEKNDTEEKERCMIGTGFVNGLVQIRKL